MMAGSGPDRTRALEPAFGLRLPHAEPALLRRRAARTVVTALRRFVPVALHGRGRPGSGVRALRLLFEDLGATYVKFGQLLGSAPGAFGEDLAAEFRSCLDSGPPVEAGELIRCVENSLGAALHDVFDEFEAEPIAAASIAVVHRARLRDSTPVAVKVLRPGIEETMTADLDIIEPVVRVLSNRIGLDIAGPFLDAVRILRRQVAEELDLRNEARTLAHFTTVLDEIDIPHLRVPRPFLEHSGRSVLTMEYLDGIPIDDLDQIELRGLDPRPLVEALVQTWFLTSLRDGVFHGDIHAGNLLLLRDGGIGIVDWGIVGRLDPETLAFFRALVRAALGDEDAWPYVTDRLVSRYGGALQAGLGMADDELRRVVRAQIEPLLTLPFGEVSLGTLLVGPTEARALAEDSPQSTTWRATAGRMRENRPARRLIAATEDGSLTEFDHGLFLLAKQLLYFERYGKMFLADIALLEDETFFRAVLDDVDDTDSHALGRHAQDLEPR